MSIRSICAAGKHVPFVLPCHLRREPIETVKLYSQGERVFSALYIPPLTVEVVLGANFPQNLQPAKRFEHDGIANDPSGCSWCK